MLGWCGVSPAAGSRASCATSTAASSILLVTAIGATAARIFTSLRRVRQEKSGSPPWQKSELLLLALFGVLITLHTAALVVVGVSGGAAAQYYGQACIIAAWSCTLGSFAAYRAQGALRLVRLVVWEAALLYGVTLFVHAWNAEGAAGSVFLLVMNAIELVLAVMAGLASLRSPPLPSSDLSEPLLADLERGGEPQKRERSWYSLIGTALQHVWPHSLGMQARVVACLLIVAAQRLVNLAVPILYRDVINRASEITSAVRPGAQAARVSFTFMQAFYPYALAYILVAYVQGSLGSAGLLRGLRSWLWQPVSQDAYKRISMLLFDHMMDLDLRFHLMRRTGEISKICDRGTDAMQDILSMVLFGSLPQLFDIVVSCAYMATALQPWIALIVFVLLVTYIPLSVYLTEQKGKIRKEMNQYSNDQGACLTDALLNYETVKNFGNEGVESGKFGTAIDKYQAAEYTMVMSFNVVGLLQGTIVFSATVLGLVLCIKEIAEGKLTVGDLVLFLALMAQLYGPLNYFASLYRQVQKNMMNMDQMLEMLEIEPSVKDAPDAKEFVSSKCTLEFHNVSFGYTPDAPVLRDISFRLEGGQTLALVGETGSGKSTALRLLFRYFDPTSGSVTIDGQDLKTVTQKSFRRHLAVVPQDTVLFNMSIRENIRYGRPGCSDADVEAAATASAIHEAITTRFPKGYDTVVGERGLRLSGGEKQRVAFARALLKNPGMLLLDEATSSLDTLTERRIQSALAGSRDARTTVIVAHRLSTVMDADLIVCFKEGRVVEQGRHEELIRLGGLYHELWTKQEWASAPAEDRSDELQAPAMA